MVWSRFKRFIMSSKIISVFNRLLPRFICVVIVSVLFGFALIINGNAAEFVITQSQFNSIEPYAEFQLRNASRYYTASGLTTDFASNGSFNIHRFDSFSPGSQGGLTVSNYGVNTVKVMWQIPVNLKKGDTFTCSFDITFDLDPVTNFLPNAISFFFGPSGDEFMGFEWTDNWSDNPDIYFIPRTSSIQKNVSIPSSLSRWFPSSYVGSTVGAVEKATVSGSFTYRGIVDEDTTYLYMAMFTNPIIRNNGYWVQFTDNVRFTISNFLAMDGNSAVTNGLLGDISNGIGDINENLNGIDNSLQGSPTEDFNMGVANDYVNAEKELADQFESAFSDTGVYMDDALSLFTTNEYAKFNVRAVRFIGDLLAHAIEDLSIVKKVLYVSLTLGFLATLLGIATSVGKNKSNKGKSSKKGSG